jgi:Ras-related C3 botulinum toxin substrate 1
MKRLKVVVIGDDRHPDHPKTRFLLTYRDHADPGEYLATVFDNIKTRIMVDDRQVELQLWDTSGQEDHKKLRPLSYPQTDVFIATFSVVSPTSLGNIETTWIPELREHCPRTPVILVGLESELRDEVAANPDEWKSKGMEAVPSSKGEEMKTRIGALGYLECSTKTMVNIDETFEMAARACLPASESVSHEGGCCEVF